MPGKSLEAKSNVARKAVSEQSCNPSLESLVVDHDEANGVQHASPSGWCSGCVLTPCPLIDEQCSTKGRLGIGVALIMGGYPALLLIPLVVTADLQPQLKAAVTGLLGLTPLLTKLAAVALIGRPAFNLIRRQMIRFLQARSGLPRS
jgi:hypothetical protein